jgi:hypothetical protein
MKQLGIFLAGFASGWVVRSTVDSSRGLAVSGVSAVFGTLERVRRVLAIEKEHLEDLVAEGKAKHAAGRRQGSVTGREGIVAASAVSAASASSSPVTRVRAA